MIAQPCLEVLTMQYALYWFAPVYEPEHSHTNTTLSNSPLWTFQVCLPEYKDTSVGTSVCLSITIYLLTHLYEPSRFDCPSTRTNMLENLTIYLSICLSIYLFVCLSNSPLWTFHVWLPEYKDTSVRKSFASMDWRYSDIFFWNLFQLICTNIWLLLLKTRFYKIRGCYSGNKFHLKLLKIKYFVGGKLVFWCNWREVGKKGGEKRKGVKGKFSLRIVCQNHIPFPLISMNQIGFKILLLKL